MNEEYKKIEQQLFPQCENEKHENCIETTEEWYRDRREVRCSCPCHWL